MVPTSHIPRTYLQYIVLVPYMPLHSSFLRFISISGLHKPGSTVHHAHQHMTYFHISCSSTLHTYDISAISNQQSAHQIIIVIRATMPRHFLPASGRTTLYPGFEYTSYSSMLRHFRALHIQIRVGKPGSTS
jgi:hypothetical protein